MRFLKESIVPNSPSQRLENYIIIGMNAFFARYSSR